MHSSIIDPPVINHLEGDTSTSLLLRWSKPSSVSVDWYEVQYTENNNCSKALDLSGVQSETVNVTGNRTEVRLSNLKKWTCYEVRIRGAVINGTSYTNFSTSVRNRTLEDGEWAQ